MGETSVTPMKKTILSLLVAIGLIGSASADTFGTGSNQFTLDFTSIGNAGNAADPLTGYGSVGYNYRIGTYDISQNQIDAATASGLQNVIAGRWSGDQPAANMTWYESAAFVNWLNTSKGFQPAYNLTWSGSTWSMALWTVSDSGYNSNNLYRNSLAKYFLPSENEFYKAAYGKSDGSAYYLYPTASNSAPTAVSSGTAAGTAVYNQSFGQGPALVYQAGGASSYGSMGQGGNVYQWEESSFSGNNSAPTADRVVRGGNWTTTYLPVLQSSSSFSRNNQSPGASFQDIGFRVASVAAVPEPSTYALFGLGALALVIAYHRKVA